MTTAIFVVDRAGFAENSGLISQSVTHCITRKKKGSFQFSEHPKSHTGYLFYTLLFYLSFPAIGKRICSNSVLVIGDNKDDYCG
jgi:hypothetical protein